MYVNDTIDIFIEEILRDESVWKEKMLPILTLFYEECIAPEIVRNNLGKGLNCVDPPYIREAMRKYQKAQEDKKKIKG